MVKKIGSFEYEHTLFGRKEELKVSPFYPGYFHLTNAVAALKSVKGMDLTGSPRRVLDVGCGRGATSKAIKKYRPDLEIWAIDIGRDSLEQAKEEPCGVNFVYGDAHKIPFPDNTFDAVFTFDVMEHLDDPARAISEIKRVLKKGGTLALSCPTEGNITTLHGFLWRVFRINLKEKYVGHVQMYTLGQLKNLLESHGFKIIRWGWSNYLFNQIVDLSHYVPIPLLKRKPEERLAEKPIKERSKSLKALGDAVFKLGCFLNFLESKFFSFIPGQTVHIHAINDRAK